MKEHFQLILIQGMVAESQTLMRRKMLQVAVANSSSSGQSDKMKKFALSATNDADIPPQNPPQNINNHSKP